MIGGLFMDSIIIVGLFAGIFVGIRLVTASLYAILPRRGRPRDEHKVKTQMALICVALTAFRFWGFFTSHSHPIRYLGLTALLMAWYMLVEWVCSINAKLDTQVGMKPWIFIL